MLGRKHQLRWDMQPSWGPEVGLNEAEPDFSQPDTSVGPRHNL